MRRLGIALALSLLAASAAITASAAGGMGGTRDEEGVGHSEPNSKSAADAQRGAEEDALRSAVENAVKELMGDKAEAEKAAVVKDKVLKNARRYVGEFRALDRSSAGGTVIEKVRAKVAIDLLRADLVAAGLLAPEGPTTALTRVVVLPAPSKTGGAPWWAQGGAANAPEPLAMTLVTALRAKGFDVVEPRRAEPDPNATASPTPGPTPDMANDNLLSVAKSYAVDLAVKVPFDVQVTVKGLDGISYALAHAKVGPVEAIAVKDGTDVATVDGEGVAGEVLDPVRAKGPVPADVAARISAAALGDAADDAAVHLTAALGDPVAKNGASTTIQLVVAGLDSYVVYARFDGALQHELKTIRGASLHAIERGEATYELSLDKNADAAAVADELAKHDFTDFGVKVTEKTPTRVVVHVNR